MDDLREELARDIFIADNSEFPESQMLAKWESHSADHLRPLARIVADGLIAKGYGKLAQQ